ELLAALGAAAYLFLPVHLLQPVDWWNIGGRFLAVTALFGALLPHGGIAGRRRLFFVPVILASIYYPIAMTRHWYAFDRRAAAFGPDDAARSPLVEQYGELRLYKVRHLGSIAGFRSRSCCCWRRRSRPSGSRATSRCSTCPITCRRSRSGIITKIRNGISPAF